MITCTETIQTGYFPLARICNIALLASWAWPQPGDRGLSSLPSDSSSSCSSSHLRESLQSQPSQPSQPSCNISYQESAHLAASALATQPDCAAAILPIEPLLAMVTASPSEPMPTDSNSKRRTLRALLIAPDAQNLIMTQNLLNFFGFRCR